MLAGNNSILQRVADAKTRTDESQIKEEIGLAWNGVQTEGITNNWDISKKSEELQKDLQKQDLSASTTVSESNIEVSYKGYETTINDETGAITNFAKSKITISLTRIGTSVTQEEVLANMPSGFYYIGGSIDEGLVISDVENDSMIPADSTGNQFVFVPVEKNQAIKLNVNSEEDIQSIVLYNPVGNKIVDLTNQGKSYNTTIKAINDDGETAKSDIINGKYKAMVVTENETKTAYLVVRSLYAIYAPNDYFSSEEYINKITTSKGISREQLFEQASHFPGFQGTISNEDDFGSFVAKSYANGGLETENYVKSVNTNGGFYIGRYEAIKNEDNAESKKATVTGTTDNASSLTSGMVWNYISQTEALTKTKAFNTKSSLPTGSAWDRTLCWLIETKK